MSTGTGGVTYVDGMWVENDALRIAERISEYDPNLRVQYLESEAKLGDPPFRIVEHCKDGKDRVLFSVWTLDERVLQRIMVVDTHRSNVSELLIIKNSQLRDQRRRYKREQLHEDSLIAAGILSSPKDSYTVQVPATGKKITIRSNGTVKRWT